MSEEVLDVVDENDRVIGKDTRFNIHHSKSWHRGIHVIILNGKGEMLLQMRGPEQDKYPNTYDLSVSEHAKAGESYDQAAKRGLSEELGIKDAKPRKLLHLKMEYGPFDRSITVLYELKYDGEIIVDDKETISVSYLPVDEVKRMLKAEKEKFAYWAYEIIKWYFGLDTMVKELNPGS